MDSFGLRPDRFDSAGQDQLVDIRDLQATLPGLTRLREWAHTALALLPGEHAVDIGSGSGSEVIAFADAVGPAGVAAGVEPDPRLLTRAHNRAAEADSTATFHSGDAYGVPFGSDTFDAVLCERVFQHLTAPLRAAQEIARVLRPGGRAVVMDADWGSAIVHPGNQRVVREVVDTLVSATTNPYAGRRLQGLLTQAGLEVVSTGSQALVQERSVGAGALVSRVSAMAVARRVITETEREHLLTALAAGEASGDIHLSVTMFAVHARKV